MQLLAHNREFLCIPSLVATHTHTIKFGKKYIFWFVTFLVAFLLCQLGSTSIAAHLRDLSFSFALISNSKADTLLIGKRYHGISTKIGNRKGERMWVGGGSGERKREETLHFVFLSFHEAIAVSVGEPLDFLFGTLVSSYDAFLQFSR